MKFIKTLALAIGCSLFIIAPVFAGQKYVNEKNGYEINLVDGDISAMSSDFALTMDSKTQTVYFVGGVNNILDKTSTGEFNNLYMAFANLEKLQGGGPVVVTDKTYDELLINTPNTGINNLLANLKHVEFTYNTSTVNKLPAIHFTIAKWDDSLLGQKLPFGVNDFYLFSENDIIYVLGTFSPQMLPSKETAYTFSKFLKSFRTIKPNSINNRFGYTDTIIGYYLPLPKNWCYIHGKLGELGGFTVAMPLDSILAIEKTLKNIDQTATEGLTNPEMVKTLIKAANEGIITFSSRNPLDKKSMPYQILNTVRNNDTKHTNLFVEQFKKNLVSELNKYNVSINYNAVASNYDTNKNLTINLKSKLVYDNNFPIVLNSKIVINDNLFCSISYFKHTCEKSSQSPNLALIRRVDNLHLVQE